MNLAGPVVIDCWAGRVAFVPTLWRSWGQWTIMRFMTVDVWVSLRLRLATEDPAPLVEPLTDCERVTLTYLGGHLSIGEIAAILHVSVNTTKTHVRNIYRKLGVGCRRDAVRRSRMSVY